MATNTGKPPGIDPNTSTSTNQGAGGIASLINQIEQSNKIEEAEAEGVFSGINGILGGLPVAERNQEYFLIINEAGDTSPEIIDQTQFKITYVCDSQLNVSKPSQDSVTVQNINQNFERQKNAIVRVDQGTVLNNQLLGKHNITAVGSIEPILGTQIGNGPYAYVTTMSFQLQDQLGTAPGVEVADYYLWAKKTVGLSNQKVSYNNDGSIIFKFRPGFNDYGADPKDFEIDPPVSLLFTLDSEFSASYDNPFRLFTDTLQAGGATPGINGFITASNNEINPTSTPSNVDTNNGYINVLQCVTSSLTGNSRIKFKAQVGLSIATSSMVDIFKTWKFSNEGSFIDRYQTMRLSIWKKDSSTGTREKLAYSWKTIDTYNANAAEWFDSPSALTQLTNFFYGAYDPSTSVSDFWIPNQSRYWEVETEYIDVNQNDQIYSTIEFPNELSASSDIYTNEFTQSLKSWKDKATYRTYNIFDSNIYVTQETPPGNLFINGVTGVTASYFNSEGDQTIYNNTGSYWVGFNTVFEGRKSITYITASTALTNFYGGEYTQVNAGTEDYNVVNANLSPSSSLYVGGLAESNKLTFTNFGFNPIRLPFTVIPGDFIRFEYSKSKTYMINSVSSVNNTLILGLQGNISPSTILDNFVIYRILDNGQFIILDVKKNNEVSVDQRFTGIVLPEYPSENLQNNSDQLIYQLKQANIIET